MNANALLHLTAGNAELILAPEVGASIVAYRHHRKGQISNWMRSVSPAAIAAGSVSDMACFPLVPWSGRLRDGTFMFDGQRITVPSTKRDSPNTIHGIARYKPWQVLHTTSNTARLRYTHEPDSWPFAFITEQEFALDDGSLSIILRVRNTGDTAMPVGVGHHPYFPRNEHTTITTQVGKAWFSDKDVMPTHIGNHPAAPVLATGMRVDDYVLDNAFLDWQHEATIDWPDQSRSLTLSAQAPLNYLILYSPPGADWFCAEPVSNTTDCFNLIHKLSRHDVGGAVLEPGEQLETCFTLAPEFY